jgi:type I restriction enzyme S subunit
MTALLTEHLATWIAADTTEKSARGRSAAASLYGVKKLRELILELAVRGLLVPQNPDDEPASELLKKIAAEKAKLVKEGKIKAQKPLPPIGDDEKPFELPKGWEWVRLGSVAFPQAGFAFKSNFFNDIGDGLPLIRIRDVGQIITGTFYSGEYKEEFVVNHGDYLISMDGQFRVAKWENGKALLNQRVTRLVFYFADIGKSFIASSLQARLLELQGVKAYTTVDHLSGSQILEAVLALPPLAEQHRIVTKVDELMALCDQLEQQQNNSQTAHQHLVSQLLNALTQAANANDFQHTWQRIAIHFDVLFTTEDSINQLKQSILQLAVMGKLVPQNPNDEPASELLKKIAAEKAQLVKEGKIKAQKPLPPIGDDEKPFELPKGWEWVRLGEITEIKGGKRVSNGYQLLTYPTPYIYIRVTDMKDGSIDDTDLRYIDKDMYEKISRYIITKNDIYMTIVGATIGKCGLIPEKFDQMNLTENAARITPSSCIEKVFLYKCLDGAICQNQFLDKTKQVGVQKMALNRLADTTIPLPPLAEQQRIVTKVDQLMALCDQLKNQLNQAKHLQGKIADVLVEQALSNNV